MNFKNIATVIIFLFGLCQDASAQMNLLGSVETGAPGETVCVKISMEGITDLVSSQFILETDTNLLSFKEIKNFNLPGLASTNFQETTPGILRFVWFDPTTFGVPISGPDILFEVCYEIVSTELTTANILFAEIADVFEIEISTADASIFGASEIDLVHGKVIINNGSAPNFSIRIDHSSGAVGENVCVDVIAEEVLNVISQQYEILYDPSIISFTNINSLAMEIPPSMFNGDNIAGGISFAWTDMNLIPLFLEPEEKMFQLCYDLIGAEGQVSSLQFNDEVDQIEIGDANLNSLNPILEAGSLSIQTSAGTSDILSVNVFSEEGLSHNEDELMISLNGNELTQEVTQQYNSESNAIVAGTNLLTFYQNVSLDEDYGGLSTLDLVLGIKMILEQVNYTPLSAMSLDLDESGGLNLNDFVLLRKILLQEPGVQVQPYFYVEENINFTGNFDIYNFGNFHEYSFEGQALSEYKLNFTAYKKGEASSFLFQSTDVEDREPVVLSFENVYLESGVSTILEFDVDGLEQDFNALKAALVIEEGSINILDESHTNELSFYQASDDRLHFLYASSEASENFKLKVELKTNQSGYAANLIKLASYIQNELVYEDHSVVELVLEGRAITVEEEIEFEAFPNPFYEMIRVNIPKKYENGQMTIFSSEGKIILSEKIISKEKMLDRNVLGPDAIYYVRVTNGTSNETIKLVSKTIK